MKLSEVPNLAKFERFAQQNANRIEVQQAYHLVRERLDPLPDHSGGGMRPEDANTMAMIDDMAQRCQAIEESTRIIWACAASLGEIDPPMFDGNQPSFSDALNYFWELKDLEWMDLTHHHRIGWEQRAGRSPFI